MRNFGTSVLLPFAQKTCLFSNKKHRSLLRNTKVTFYLLVTNKVVSSYPHVPIKIQGPSIPMGRDAAPANMTLIALQAPVTISVQVGKITPVVGFKADTMNRDSRNMMCVRKTRCT